MEIQVARCPDIWPIIFALAPTNRPKKKYNIAIYACFQEFTLGHIFTYIKFCSNKIPSTWQGRREVFRGNRKASGGGHIAYFS